MITQTELKNIINYNPETGQFTWLVSCGSVKKGDKAKVNHSEGYITIVIAKKKYKAHRLAYFYMTGKMPSNDMDHLNGNRADNRWSNLRAATRKENAKNKRLRKDSKSGVHGVTLQKGKWHSRIENKHLCVSYDKFEAICVRKSAENKLGYHENHGR